MRLVGDVHGRITDYLQVVGPGPSLQVGDLGLGFKGVHLPPISKAHRFIRGNHDNPAICKCHKNYAGDFGFWSDHNLFFLGGAYTINRNDFIPMVSWWPDEQLNIKQFEEAAALYVTRRPRFMVTHDCPSKVRDHILNKLTVGMPGEKNIETPTALNLQIMFELYRPEVWVFGHYHLDMDFVLDGTRFICLGMLKTLDLEQLCR